MRLVVPLLLSLAFTQVAAARPPMLDDDVDRYAKPPPPTPPTPTHLAHDDDHDDDRSEHARWRLEGGFGARFGSFLVNGTSVGTVTPGHVEAGLRKGRILIDGEYQLMSLGLPPEAMTSPRGAADAPLPALAGRGLMHRVGANARYSFGRVGEHDGGADLFVEGGFGLQHFRWDAGGVWTRPDLSLGLGGALWGQGDHRHGGFAVALRVNLARRDDNTDGPIACGGPCDQATKPVGWDRSFLFDMTVMFGK
ncbi:MAG: hypothetical protein NT062_37375 [Proteobacteria bacterium]|nr:hypothetical protein [Pseudomonadota bacterium]